MTSPLPSFVAVQFVTSDSTAATDLQWDQRVFLFPPEYLSALGSGPANPGVLAGVRGYLAAGGPTGQQWVMTSWQTTAIKTAFAQVPGATGWRSSTSRQTYANIGKTLVETYGVTPGDAITALTNLYGAAATNEKTAAGSG